VTLAPDADDLHRDLALVAELTVAHFLAQADPQGYLPPLSIGEGRGAPQIQANDEVELSGHQVHQEFQVTELAIQHQRFVAQESLDLVKSLPMILVAGTGHLGAIVREE
jgi:hypothetical protein